MLCTHTTHGSFMVMKILTAMKAAMIQKKAKEKSMVRFSLLRPTVLERSRMIKPTPPRVNRKLDASPSMMYCPLTRYCMNATGRGFPNSSIVE